MKPLDEARRAAQRGAHDEALVQLWNSIEPARIAGDRRALSRIESLADLIVQVGDEAQAREAQRLLDLLQERVRDETQSPATARIDGDLSPEGEAALGELEPGGAVRTGELEAEVGGRRSGIGTVIWLVVVLVVIVVNLLEQVR